MTHEQEASPVGSLRPFLVESAGVGIACARNGEYGRDEAFPTTRRGALMYRSNLPALPTPTVTAGELYHALRQRAERGPLVVTLLAPQDRQAGLGQRVNAAL